MRPMRCLVFLCCMLLAACGGDEATQAPLPEALACQAGAWRLPDGDTLVLTPATGGLRYRMFDGRSGLFRPGDRDADGRYRAREGWRATGEFTAAAVFGDCADGRLRFEYADGPRGEATRVPLHVRDTRFDSGGLSLRGRLLLPSGAAGAVPLAVLVHGSERYSGVDAYALQYLLPAHGIAVFVYDKRGTGGSEGTYTQDFPLLAGDAQAALAEARRLAPRAFSHVGFVGASQGGWVAPLAASRGDADYVVVLYGLAEDALAEDREQVFDGLRAKGHGEEVIAQAGEVTDATARLMASGFTRGFEELRAVKARYRDAPWLQDVEGEFSGELLRIPDWMPQWIVRRIAAGRDEGTSWDYDPMPVLDALRAPQLWVIAGADLEAPNRETLRRLGQLQARGRPLDLAVFPRTDHGIYLFEEDGGGRTMLRHPEGYHRLLVDWIAHRALPPGPFGDAALTPRAAAARDAGGAAAPEPVPE